MANLQGSELESISNQELLERLQALLGKSRSAEVALLVHLAEVDARRLYLEEAFPSMFEYCVRQLRMEEGVAYNRIYAARAARQHPALLEALRSGALHLTGVRLLAPLLTPENASDWIQAARPRSVREIRQLIADRQPKPDVGASMRRQRVRSETTRSKPALQPRTLAVEEASRASAVPSVPAVLAPAAPSRPARSEPLGRGRYSVKFTADEECSAALGELRSLLRHEVPDGDLAEILKRAVSELLVKTRKRKFAELAAGREARSTPESP